jgi:formamidopyrimidine-DNA glycosylase
MPESAEVRLTTEFLDKELRGKMVTDWVFCSGKHTEEFPKGYEEFLSKLPLRIERVCCKGKFIYFQFDKDVAILHSMMMTGSWRKSYDKMCKWFVEFNGKSGRNKTLWFCDPRAMGTLIFTGDPLVLQNKLDYLGPDILREEFTLPTFIALSERYSRRNITAFLMDQAVIAGVGNIIKAESLYRSRISPLRSIGSLSLEELKCLYTSLREIPANAVRSGGFSIRNFDVDGKKGTSQKGMKVYGKKTAKRTKTADGRITYWFPDKQK